MSRSRALLNGMFLLCIAALVAACGGEKTPVEPTATAGPPTAAPGQMTVADVIALSDDAWPSVQSMRTTSQTSVTTSDAPQVFNGSVQDWTPNGNRHIVEFQDGSPVNEQIYAGGVIYMRGVFVSAAIAPGLDINTWVIIDPGADPETPLGIQVIYLTRAQTDPYGELSDDILQRPVKESGNVTVGDRSCTLYTFGDEANTGNEIRYEIAVGDDGLPCQVVLRGGTSQNSTVYEFNTGITITAPLDGTPEAATPTP